MERRIRTAELLAVGSELTNGETRDTNGGELASLLAGAGVTVRRITALPDDLALVTRAFADALDRVDLVVSTGGLGPTPDDLTREALAAAVGEEPAVQPALEAWLRDLFARRGTHLPEGNLKQAWLIPSAFALENPNGTAPGWWVDRPDGRVAVLLPGPPREMRPMWHDRAWPRLLARGVGDGRLVRTLRLYGVGESQVAELLGEAMLRAPNPVVATYARADWLDVRIAAVDEPARDGSAAVPAAAVLAQAEAAVRQRLGGWVWAEGDTGWADLVREATDRAGVRLATVETGTRGSLAALLAGVPALRRSVVAGPGADPAAEPGDPGAGIDDQAWHVEEAARSAAEAAGVELGLALAAHASGTRTLLRAAVARPDRGWSRSLELRLFQHGDHGRFRAAVAAAAHLVEVLRGDAS